MDEDIKNLILATPVIGVLLFFLKYFIKNYEEEKKINKERDEKQEKKIEQDTKIMQGLSGHLEDSNKKHEESNKKHDETNVKIDHIIRKLDK